MFVDNVRAIPDQVGNVLHRQVIECQGDEGMATVVLGKVEGHMATLYQTFY